MKVMLLRMLRGMDAFDAGLGLIGIGVAFRWGMPTALFVVGACLWVTAIVIRVVRR